MQNKNIKLSNKKIDKQIVIFVWNQRMEIITLFQP